MVPDLINDLRRQIKELDSIIQEVIRQNEQLCEAIARLNQNPEGNTRHVPPLSRAPRRYTGLQTPSEELRPKLNRAYRSVSSSTDETT